jgi:hypothetical protein
MERGKLLVGVFVVRKKFNFDCDIIFSPKIFGGQGLEVDVEFVLGGGKREEASLEFELGEVVGRLGAARDSLWRVSREEAGVGRRRKGLEIELGGTGEGGRRDEGGRDSNSPSLCSNGQRPPVGGTGPDSEPKN